MYYHILDDLFLDLLLLLHHLQGWWKRGNKNLYRLQNIARLLKLYLLSYQGIQDLGYQTWSDCLYWNENGVKVGSGEYNLKTIGPLVEIRKY